MNKRIAELRGDNPDIRCTLRVGMECPDESLETESECPKKCEYLNPDYKPYDTDIACAMELLPEMREAGDVEINMYCGDTAVSLLFIVSNSEVYKLVEDTLCLAIAGAWLKWTEGV